ncbi:MAG TPA: hypothetical protein VL173_03140 [Vicinamibacterales bacterium]|nr:hypothetical protein [Vicinamibacterales bacterium]
MSTPPPARPRVHARVMTIAFSVAIAAASASPGAQWFTYPSPRAPRTAAGNVDLTAATPRLANGKPDLSGVWMTADPLCVIRGTAPIDDLRKMNPPSLKCPPRTASFSRQSIHIGIDMPGGLPYQPWLAKIVEERTRTQSIDDPHIRCLPDFFVRAYGLPHFLKFAQAPDLLLMLNEYNGTYRQVFTDGRPLPKDPNPSWQGYSTASWDGDALIVESSGFRDDLWLDWDGSMVTGAGRIRERITRPDFGHLEIAITVDDPKAYTRPWSVSFRQQFAPDTELIDEICAEGEKFAHGLK